MEIEKKEKTDQRNPSHNSNSPTIDVTGATPNADLFDEYFLSDDVSFDEMLARSESQRDRSN